MRHTLASFKAAYNWQQTLNLSSTDPRWLQLLNEALEQLMTMGMWVGTWQRYRIATHDNQITWPRQFQTIQVVDICGIPTPVRNEWYEYLEQGPGMWSACSDCDTLKYIDRGNGFVMFDDLRVESYLRLYPQFAADVGKVVNIRGYDTNHQWVLTNNGATVGEDVTLALPYVDTVTAWMPQVFREVIKAETVGHVRAYSFAIDDVNWPGSPGNVTLTAMAVWEPSETVPNYRRCVIPTLDDAGGCCTDASLVGSTAKPTVTVQAKLAFIPLSSDLDVLPLQNGPAIKLAMLALTRKERGDDAGARAAMYGVLDPVRRKFVDGAIPLLEDELDQHEGYGVTAPLRLERSIDNAGVYNLI